MGFYQGYGARLAWRSKLVKGMRQPAFTFTPGINMVQCHWSPSIEISIDQTWPPGTYLLKLVSSLGQQQFVSLTVRDDTSKAVFMIQNSVNTWQAYNRWGGYSLYLGKNASGASFANRSRVVSFDRPYPLDWANGAADFLGLEYPLIFLAEKLGLDVSYWTDVDLDQRGSELNNHKTLMSLGHDEYWSLPMRASASQARDKGVNLVFFAANACYRRIRYQSSPLGPRRQIICYKIPTEDPLYGKNNAAVTANWPDPPAARPESSLIGQSYGGYGVSAPMQIVHASSWLFANTGLKDGNKLAGVIGPEFDHFVPGSLGPQNIEILAHSPVASHSVPTFSDLTYYSASSGAGVLTTGTNRWIFTLSDNKGHFNQGVVPPAVPGVTQPLIEATKNIFSFFGKGPAGQFHPSKPNWKRFYV